MEWGTVSGFHPGVKSSGVLNYYCRRGRESLDPEAQTFDTIGSSDPRVLHSAVAADYAEPQPVVRQPGRVDAKHHGTPGRDRKLGECSYEDVILTYHVILTIQVVLRQWRQQRQWIMWSLHLQVCFSKVVAHTGSFSDLISARSLRKFIIVSESGRYMLGSPTHVGPSSTGLSRLNTVSSLRIM